MNSVSVADSFEIEIIQRHWVVLGATRGDWAKVHKGLAYRGQWAPPGEGDIGQGRAVTGNVSPVPVTLGATPPAVMPVTLSAVE